MVFTVLLAIIAISIAEGLQLARGKLWKELTTMGILLGIALLLVIGNELDLPSPIAMMGELLSPIGKAFFTKN